MHTATLSLPAAGAGAAPYAVGGSGTAGPPTSAWIVARGATCQPGLWVQTMLGVYSTGRPEGPSQPTLTVTSGEPTPGDGLHLELAAQITTTRPGYWLFSFTSPGPVHLGLALPACAGRSLRVGADADASVFLADPFGPAAQLHLPVAANMLGTRVHLTAVVTQLAQPRLFDVANGLSIYVN